MLTGELRTGGRPHSEVLQGGADMARSATAASRVSEISRLSGILMLASMSALMLASITPRHVAGNVRASLERVDTWRIIITLTSYASIVSKIELSGATKLRD